MDLTTSYKYIGSSPEDGPVIASAWNKAKTVKYYSKFYAEVKVKTYNASNATLTAHVFIRNNWMGWKSQHTVIKLTGVNTHSFVSSGTTAWDGAWGGGTGSGSSNYATLWEDTFDFNVNYDESFSLGAQISGDAISTCSPSETCRVIKPAVTITYNANGGTGAPTAQSISRNSTATLSSTIPSKDPGVIETYTITFDVNGAGGQIIGGTSSATSLKTVPYSFKEWNTAQDGTGTPYAAGGSITVGTSDIILYAQWNPGQTATSPVTMPSAIRSGYTLLGWSTNSSASTADPGKTPGAQWVPTSTIPLYAIWKSQTVALKLCQEIFDLIYPIGSIYMTIIDVNPSQKFGGTWTRIGTGRTLISAGGGTNPVADSNTDTTRGTYTGVTTNFTVGTRGGESDHQLILSEAPSHRHTISLQVYNGGGSTGSVYGITNFKDGWDTFSRSTPGSSGYLRWGETAEGGDGTHNNIQPYFAVYMWQRIA